MGLPVFYISRTIRSASAKTAPRSAIELWRPSGDPNLLVIRPADANEVGRSLQIRSAAERSARGVGANPADLPTLDRTKYASAEGLQRGGYVLADAGDCPAGGLSQFSFDENGTVPFSAGKPVRPPDVILIGTGSEVSLCVDAYERLKTEGVKARVVSMPSWELFDGPATILSRRRPATVRLTRRVAVGARCQARLECYIGQTANHRHVQLRRLRPHRRPAEAFRLHGRERRGSGEEVSRSMTLLDAEAIHAKNLRETVPSAVDVLTPLTSPSVTLYRFSLALSLRPFPGLSCFELFSPARAISRTSDRTRTCIHKSAIYILG